MGGVIGKAADGVGGFIGNAVTAPFKTILGRSCKDACSGPWDVTCFIEHFCISDLLKLVMISALCFTILMFFYLLFKLGICQCMVKSLCKMCFAACETYWCTIGDMTCFLWHKLTNTKRARRRRRIRDIEAAVYGSSDENDFSDGYDSQSVGRKRRRDRKTRKGRSSRHHHHVKLRTKEVSRRVGSLRKLQFSRGKIHHGRVEYFKRRKLT